MLLKTVVSFTINEQQKKLCYHMIQLQLNYDWYDQTAPIQQNVAPLTEPNSGTLPTFPIAMSPSSKDEKYK